MKKRTYQQKTGGGFWKVLFLFSLLLSLACVDSTSDQFSEFRSQSSIEREFCTMKIPGTNNDSLPEQFFAGPASLIEKYSKVASDYISGELDQCLQGKSKIQELACRSFTYQTNRGQKESFMVTCYDSENNLLYRKGTKAAQWEKLKATNPEERARYFWLDSNSKNSNLSCRYLGRNEKKGAIFPLEANDHEYWDCTTSGEKSCTELGLDNNELAKHFYSRRFQEFKSNCFKSSGCLHPVTESKSLRLQIGGLSIKLASDGKLDIKNQCDEIYTKPFPVDTEAFAEILQSYGNDYFTGFINSAIDGFDEEAIGYLQYKSQR